MKGSSARSPHFFESPSAFRAWLAEHHAEATELWVGFWKKGTGKPSLTWSESVDEALCYGWIDGVRKRVDEASYTIRFTPRKAVSNWSAVNIRKMETLIAAGRVARAGLAAWKRRQDERSEVYSYEQRRRAKLTPEMERRFRAREKAWSWFSAQPPGYRRTATFWVTSAKLETTRERRLDQLIRCSAAGERIPPLRRTPPGRT